MSKMLDEIMDFVGSYADFSRDHVSKALRTNVDVEEDGMIIKSFRVPKKVNGTKLKQESWDWRCKAYPPDVFEDEEQNIEGCSIFFWREKDQILKTAKFAKKYIVDNNLVTHKQLSAAFQHPTILKTSFGVNVKVATSDEQNVLMLWVYGK